MHEWLALYRAMDRHAAFLEAARLIAEAHHSGCWFSLPERLNVLRSAVSRDDETLDRLMR